MTSFHASLTFKYGLQTTKVSPIPIGLFLDLNSLPTNDEAYLLALLAKCRRNFCIGHSEVKFVCVKKVQHSKTKNVSKCLLSNKINLIHISEESSTSTVDILEYQLECFAQNYPPPATVLILSDDNQLSSTIEDLKERRRLHVIVISNEVCLSNFKKYAHETYTLSSLLGDTQTIKDLDNIDKGLRKKESTTLSRTELLITNINDLGSIATLHPVLQRLVDSFKGNVITVTENLALIRFSSKKETKRAKNKLQTHKIGDTLIKVEFPKLIGKSKKKKKKKNKKCSNVTPSNSKYNLEDVSAELNSSVENICNKSTDKSENYHSIVTENILGEVTDVPPSIPIINAFTQQTPDRIWATSLSLSSCTQRKGKGPMRKLIFCKESLIGDDVEDCVLNGIVKENELEQDSPQLNQPRAIRAKQQSPLPGNHLVSQQQPKSPSDSNQTNNNGSTQHRSTPKFNRTPTSRQYNDGRMSPSSTQYAGSWRYSPRDGGQRAPYTATNYHPDNTRAQPKNMSFSYDGFEDHHHHAPPPPPPGAGYPPSMFQHQQGFKFEGRGTHGFHHSPNPLPWRYVAPPHPFGYENQSIVNRGFPNPFSSFYHDQNHFRKTPGASRPSSRSSTCSNYSTGSSGYRGSPISSQGNSFHDSMPTSVNVFQPIRNAPNKVLTASDLCGGIPEEGSTTSDTSETSANPVELMVSNLDYNISAREWKKILFTEFQQQVQVLGVHIQTQPDNTSLAYVRLASIDEARYAISQFHRKKIGYKRIHVSLVDNTSGEQAPNVRSEITALLQEVSGNRLPLFKFIEIYEKRYHRTISVSELYRMRDLIEIQEMDGTGRMVVLINQNKSNRSSPSSVVSDNDTPELLESPVCKTHCQKGSKWYVEALDSCCLPHVQLCLKHFAPQVHTMLQGHEGSMPIMSFPACYEAEFAQTLKMVPEGGVSLEHLISCVPGVIVAVMKSGVKKVQWAENKPPSPIAIEWGKQCASPLLSNQLSQFSREVVDLLRQYPQCRMPFSKFIPSYHHHFGRQCRVADYGYTKLMELFEAIPHIVQIIGGGSRRYVTLSHRAQVKRFTSDLLRVLKSQSSKQIGVIDLSIVYNKIVGKKFDITDYGTCYLEDMLAEVPENTILVEGSGKDMVIALPRREQTPEELERMKQLALEVIDLLKNSPQCQMPFNKFIPAYHHHFGKQCRVSDYGFTKLIELFEAIPSVVDMVDQDGEKILVLTGPELLKVLEEHVTSLLKASPGHQLPVPEFLAAYMRHHGHSLSLQDYGVSSVVQLIEKIPNVAKVEEHEGRLTIALVDNSYVEHLAKRILMILMEKIEGKLTAPDLQMKHMDKFNSELSIDDIMLLSEQKDFIEVSIHDNENVIKLSSLQQFARDVRTLLRVHQGRLALNTFEAAYAQHFGVSLVPASYGYPSVVALLQAIPHMATIRGKGYRRTVLLSQDFQDKVPLSGSNAPSPVPADYGDNSVYTPSNDSGVIESQDEDELMCNRARSPFDLMAGNLPSTLPSPDLQPADYRRSPLDLMRFDPSPSPQAFQDMLTMSAVDKDSLKTPLCRTPVSEMLHLASQLLPPDQPHMQHQQPQAPPRQTPASTAFYTQPHLSCYSDLSGAVTSSYNTSSYNTSAPRDECYSYAGNGYDYGYSVPTLSAAASLLPDLSCFNMSGNDPTQQSVGSYHTSVSTQHGEFLYSNVLAQNQEFNKRQRCPIKIEKPDGSGEQVPLDSSNAGSFGSDHDTGSPNSQKQGTPRRSRLAARFNLPLSPSSVERRE